MQPLRSDVNTNVVGSVACTEDVSYSTSFYSIMCSVYCLLRIVVNDLTLLHFNLDSSQLSTSRGEALFFWSRLHPKAPRALLLPARAHLHAKTCRSLLQQQSQATEASARNTPNGLISRLSRKQTPAPPAKARPFVSLSALRVGFCS